MNEFIGILLFLGMFVCFVFLVNIPLVFEWYKDRKSCRDIYNEINATLDKEIKESQACLDKLNYKYPIDETIKPCEP
jgi:regulatory protein YycI of two-component signal transduction system YycFG